MREGRQRDVRRACELHKFRGFDDREERIGDVPSESMCEVTLHELQQKNVGTNVQVQVQCMCKPVRMSAKCDWRMQWEEKWKVMMSELGEGAKIPNLRRMSALLEICPKDVK